MRGGTSEKVCPVTMGLCGKAFCQMWESKGPASQQFPPNLDSNWKKY